MTNTYTPPSSPSPTSRDTKDNKVIPISHYLAAEDAAVAMMESAARSGNKSAALLEKNSAARLGNDNTTRPPLLDTLLKWLKPSK